MSNDLQLGIEVEFLDGEDNELVLFMQEDELAPDGWDFVRDGSCGGEAVSRPMYINEVEKQVTALIRYLNIQNAEVNQTCSVHIHVGTQGLTPYQIVRVLDGWCDFEDVFFKAFRPFPSRVERYCSPLQDTEIGDRLDEYRYYALRRWGSPNTTYQDLAYLWTGSPYKGPELEREKYNPYRYRAFNLASLWLLGTIEYRLFNGTLDPIKIYNYAKFCYGLTKLFAESYDFRINHVYERMSLIAPRYINQITRQRTLGTLFRFEDGELFGEQEEQREHEPEPAYKIAMKELIDRMDSVRGLERLIA